MGERLARGSTSISEGAETSVPSVPDVLDVVSLIV